MGESSMVRDHDMGESSMVRDHDMVESSMVRDDQVENQIVVLPEDLQQPGPMKEDLITLQDHDCPLTEAKWGPFLHALYTLSLEPFIS
ncbi:hypothetical protein Tco_0236544 [Tanacetum coccineum]